MYPDTLREWDHRRRPPDDLQVIHNVLRCRLPIPRAYLRSRLLHHSNRLFYPLPLSNDRIAHRQRLFVALVLSRELIDDRLQIGARFMPANSLLSCSSWWAARFVFFSSCCEKFSHPASVSTTNTTINPIINPRRAVVFIEYTGCVRCVQIHEAL
jgi:hypothetical protein